MEKLQPQHKYTRTCLFFPLRISVLGGLNLHTDWFLEFSTLCFCPNGQVVRLRWPSDLLPASPCSSDPGLKRSSLHPEVD